MFLDSDTEPEHKCLPTKDKNLGRERRFKERLEY
jgi:hypothetical protein